MKQLIVLLVAVALSAATLSGSSSSRKYNNSTIVTAEEYMANPEAFSSSLSDEGVWVQWTASNMGIPRYSVYAGFDTNGPSFVMRAPHQEGTLGIKIVGKYYPYKGKAYVPYAGKEQSKDSIEILTHNNHRWIHKSLPCRKIQASFQPQVEICRAKSGRFFLPGKLVLENWSDKCYYSDSGKEYSPSDYSVLCIAC